MAYRYLKDNPNKVDQPTRKLTISTITKQKRKFRWLAILFMAIGLFLLGNAIYPIVYYQLVVSPRFANQRESFAFAQQENNQPVVASDLNLVDYTKLSNWISGVDQITTNQTTSYYLSIPRLGIQSAIVSVGGDDLKKSLIQYPGTSLPGKAGNPVIFGHSTLPQFSRPDNYKSIFTFLPKLEEGDDIWVESNGVTYKYLVERLIEMGPQDMSILAQRYDDSYLTLVTCVPPGTYLKRLVVRSRITKAD